MSNFPLNPADRSLPEHLDALRLMGLDMTPSAVQATTITWRLVQLRAWERSVQALIDKGADGPDVHWEAGRIEGHALRMVLALIEWSRTP